MTAMAPVDLGDPEAAATWVDEAAAVHGGIDVLYNNASAIRMAPIDELSVRRLGISRCVTSSTRSSM